MDSEKLVTESFQKVVIGNDLTTFNSFDSVTCLACLV